MQRLTALQAGLVLLLSVCSCPVFAHRSLLQDAISNSNGCLNDIPKCEPYACVTRNIKGVARWACQRCQGGYSAVVDDSGQDNIIQCVCPRGTYEAPSATDPTLTTCARCPKGSFCPGGDRTDAPSSRGTATGCGNGLVTRNDGARSQSDCVAPKGYAMTAPDTAEPCKRSEYAPQFNRLAKCLRCQSGLEEPLNSGLDSPPGGRDSRKNVCKVPPGRYMSQGLVRICPQGFYRADYKAFDDPTAQVCVACNPGITTANAGAGLPYLCNQVVPGYGISNVMYVNGVITNPALPALNETSTAGYSAATLCGLGFYSSGGNCLQCPKGTATTKLGALSVEECVVPPGYFLPDAAASNMSLCPDGRYREGWLLVSDTRASTCTQCGVGIASEAREVDINPMLPTGTTTLVRATSASCYIEPGQGMIADGRNAFVGRDCPKDTYGASGRVYGLMSAPCKPCPRNMITDNAAKVNNSDVCTNPDGFGYASEGASRCAPGFYSAKGSRKPCQQCPFGRSTQDLPSAQRVIEDCLVRPGFGVVSSVRNTTDAFNIDISALNATQQAVLPVLECPVGSYGAGGTSGSKCLLCPAGSSTEAPGAISSSNCTVCMPGFGRATDAALTCTPCQQGYYQPGGLATCLQCPNSIFYPPVDNAGDVWTSTGTTTFLGATGQDSCVPKETQLSPEAGQAYFSNTSAAVHALLTETDATDLSACINTCNASACCLAQYNTETKKCKRATLTPAAADAAGWKLVYKLPPSTLGSASSVQKNATGVSAVVRVKMMSSGIYARAAVPDGQQTNWLAVGTNLDQTARTFSTAAQTSLWRTGSEQECKTLCDNSNVCWGFVYNGVSCLFRGGEDALKTRSFFVLPTGDLSAFKWQGATALDFAVGRTLSLAATQGLQVTGQQVVDALNAVFADTGVYDPEKALLRITGDPTAAALQAAVNLVLELAAKQGVAVTDIEARQALQSQGAGPYDAKAALQAIIDSRGVSPEALAAQVWQLQSSARDQALINPTWAQAVAVLGFTRPDAKSYDQKAALSLYEEAANLSSKVLDNVRLVSRQQAIDALLSVYAVSTALDVDKAVQMLAADGKVVDEALLSALKKGVRVTQQHVWDTIKAMRARDQGVSITADVVVDRLLDVGKAVTAMSAKLRAETAAAFTWEQHLATFIMALVDSQGNFDAAIKTTVQWTEQTLEISQGGNIAGAQPMVEAEVTLAQALDLAPLARAHQRVYWEKFANLYITTMLLRASAVPTPAQQLVDKVKEASKGATIITPAEAFAVLVDTSGQFGAAATADSSTELVSAALLQLQTRKEVQANAREVLTTAEAYIKNTYTPTEVDTAVVGLYRRSGYWGFDTSVSAPAVAAYIDLTRSATPGGPADPALAAAVSELQQSTRDKVLPTPTWSQAVALLTLTAKPDQPQSYDQAAALQLFSKKVADYSIGKVVPEAIGKGVSDASRQQAITLLLAGYQQDATLKDNDAAAVQWAIARYVELNKVVDDALLKALEAGALVSRQTVWDIMNAMQGGKEDPAQTESAITWLSTLADIAQVVRDSVAAADKDIAAAISTEQLMTVIISVLADNKGRPGLTSQWDNAEVLSVSGVNQVVKGARLIVASAALSDQKVQLPQALDFVLLGWAHQREAWQKFTDIYTPLLLPAATQQVAKDMPGGEDPAAAFGALVAVSGQIGAAADTATTDNLVAATLQQLKNRETVLEKARAVLTQKPYTYTVDQVPAGVDGVYMRSGYSTLSAAACAAYMKLLPASA